MGYATFKDSNKRCTIHVSCNACNATLSSQEKMKEHYELEHSDCLKCYDTFKKSSSVKCQNCTTRKPYECQFCKSRYTNLHEHASKCQYAFPWICSICVGVRFSNQWSL